MSIPKAPIDTSKHMRDMGRGHPEFDYSSAWREVRPLWDSLAEAPRRLLERVRGEALDLCQDAKLDLPWPRQGTLRQEFRDVSEEELARAAEIIHALGYWMPGDASDEDRRLFSGSPPDGAYWKFAYYADQSIRERHGQPWAGREPRPKTELELLLKGLGATATCRQALEDEDHPDMDGWQVRLGLGKGWMTVPFWQGRGHEGKPPSAARVVACLVSDALSVENMRSFEEWAQELGMDLNKRGALKKARQTYDACEQNGEKVRKLFGEHWGRVVEAAVEY